MYSSRVPRTLRVLQFPKLNAQFFVVLLCFAAFGSMLSQRFAKALFEFSSQSDAVITQAIADLIINQDEVGVVVV